MRRRIASAITMTAATAVETMVSTLKSMPRKCPTAWSPTLILAPESASGRPDRAIEP